jgi:hypothetical protein
LPCAGDESRFGDRTDADDLCRAHPAHAGSCSFAVAAFVFVGIFVMNADGTHVRRLTQRAGTFGTEDHAPSWSPNGKRIAFVRNARVGPTGDVYVANANGTAVRRVTNAPDLAARNPDWGPVPSSR